MHAPVIVIESLLLLASALLLARAAIAAFAQRRIGDALFPAAMGIGIMWEGVQPHTEMTLSYALILLAVAVFVGGLPVLGWLRSRGEEETPPAPPDAPPESVQP